MSGPFVVRRLLRTLGCCLLFLLLFEVVVWGIFTKTRLADGSLHRYLWYGSSYEYKLRELVNTPDLPPNSILYAGWLGDAKIRSLPKEADLTVYGMSFSGNLSTAIHELRPDLSQRVVAGPGSPMSHTYAAYQVDKKLRKTRFAVLGVTSIGVEEVTIMNHGSLYTDAAFPYFYPRYRLQDGKAVLAADSLINSADELRAALQDPEYWQRQLQVLSANDSEYKRFFFAADVLDHSVIARFIRRGIATRRADAYSADVLGAHGFRRDREAPRLFRALFRQMIDELRAENVKPIVFLVANQGQGDYLYALVEDILRDEAVPFVNSNDFCPSSDRDSYLPDMHFTRECDRKFARRTLDLIDGYDKH